MIKDLSEAGYPRAAIVGIVIKKEDKYIVVK
jgi:hypothetical protein